MDAYQDEPTFPCKVCGRKFVRSSLDKHIPACKKLTKMQRKPFDSGKQRADGSDIPYSDIKKAMKEKEKVGGVFPRPQTNWKTRHESFMDAVTSSKKVDYAIKTGAPLPPPPRTAVPSGDRKETRILHKCAYEMHRRTKTPVGRHSRIEDYPLPRWSDTDSDSDSIQPSGTTQTVMHVDDVMNVDDVTPNDDVTHVDDFMHLNPQTTNVMVIHGDKYPDTTRKHKIFANKDYVQCEYCGRNFSERAAERHIPFCRDQQRRSGKPPATSKPMTSHRPPQTSTTRSRESSQTRGEPRGRVNSKENDIEKRRRSLDTRGDETRTRGPSRHATQSATQPRQGLPPPSRRSTSAPRTPGISRLKTPNPVVRRHPQQTH